jgi:hypothetical protein
METIKIMMQDPVFIILVILFVLSNTFTALNIHGSSDPKFKLWARILLMIPPVANLFVLVVLKIKAFYYLRENFVKYFKD